jgi:hypothetical protein
MHERDPHRDFYPPPVLIFSPGAPRPPVNQRGPLFLQEK